jgi:hypothetical protein
LALPTGLPDGCQSVPIRLSGAGLRRPHHRRRRPGAALLRERSTTQDWTLVSEGSNYYKIKNANSGLLLGVANAGTASGAQVL